MGKTDTHNICTGAKIDKVGGGRVCDNGLGRFSLCDSGDEAYGFLNTSWVKKMGSRALCQYPFDQNSFFFFFYARFWLFPVILILKGECNVPPKISVTFLKKKKKKKEKSLWGPWRKFYSFKCVFKLVILLYFVIFHRREKWSLHDYIKEVWSNSKTGASRVCTSRLPSGQLRSVRGHTSAPACCSWWLLWSVCQVPATGSSQCVETILSMHRQGGTGSAKNITIQENYYFYTWNVMSGLPFVRHAILYALLCFYWV